MNNGKATGGLVAVIGKKEDLQAALSAELAGAAVFSEEIPFYPGLSIQNNVRQLRMMLPEGKQERFEALLQRTELKKDGWTHPFRKDMTGQKRLFGILEAMLTEPETLLVYDLLAGMENKQREAFAKMAESYRESGGRLVYSSKSLKDVLRMEIAQEIWLPASGGFCKTDSDAVKAKLSEAGTPEQTDALLQRMEAGEL